MTYTSLAFLIATLLGVIYVILAIIAYSHRTEEEKFNQLLWTDMWWPFYDDKYHPEAKRVVLYGKLLFPIIILAWVIWWNLQSACPPP
jgi:hypothetical protein